MTYTNIVEEYIENRSSWIANELARYKFAFINSRYTFYLDGTPVKIVNEFNYFEFTGSTLRMLVDTMQDLSGINPATAGYVVNMEKDGYYTFKKNVI